MSTDSCTDAHGTSDHTGECRVAVKRGEALTLAAMWCVALKTCCSVRDARHTRPQACDSIYVQNRPRGQSGFVGARGWGGEWGATADGDGVSFGGGGRFCDGTEVRAAQHWEGTKCHRAADFKMVPLTLCEFHLGKKKKREGGRGWGSSLLLTSRAPAREPPNWLVTERLSPLNSP